MCLMHFVFAWNRFLPQEMKSLILLTLFIRFNFALRKNRTCLITSEIVESILPSQPMEHRTLNYHHPMNISLELGVQEITRIRELTSEFELDVYVTESWYDPRLSFAHYLPCKNNTVNREIFVIKGHEKPKKDEKSSNFFAYFIRI